ncbi:MAG: hypothetical protein CMF50_09335 [Legionellales bacterium]|nr:hypothetical protein [Legionellales bacterium]|tara:strand:- start:1481 stop:3169 length:1689 start_codon:yes stop_codon:yes gene_type:complete
MKKIYHIHNRKFGKDIPIAVFNTKTKCLVLTGRFDKSRNKRIFLNEPEAKKFSECMRQLDSKFSNPKISYNNEGYSIDFTNLDITQDDLLGLGFREELKLEEAARPQSPSNRESDVYGIGVYPEYAVTSEDSTYQRSCQPLSAADTRDFFDEIARGMTVTLESSDSDEDSAKGKSVLGGTLEEALKRHNMQTRSASAVGAKQTSAGAQQSELNVLKQKVAGTIMDEQELLLAFLSESEQTKDINSLRMYCQGHGITVEGLTDTVRREGYNEISDNDVATLRQQKKVYTIDNDAFLDLKPICVFDTASKRLVITGLVTAEGDRALESEGEALACCGGLNDLLGYDLLGYDLLEDDSVPSVKKRILRSDITFTVELKKLNLIHDELASLGFVEKVSQSQNITVGEKRPLADTWAMEVASDDELDTIEKPDSKRVKRSLFQKSPHQSLADAMSGLGRADLEAVEMSTFATNIRAAIPSSPIHTGHSSDFAYLKQAARDYVMLKMEGLAEFILPDLERCQNVARLRQFCENNGINIDEQKRLGSTGSEDHQQNDTNTDGTYVLDLW